jgi:pimeloyl-ACP methyl ester carboxylesterase
MEGAPVAIEDLLVVVPGIQGTKLLKHGRPVWALSGAAFWNALRSLGDSIRGLRLPAEIGDEHPADGVEPDGLMQDIHGLPGIGPTVGGYSDLGRWVRSSLGLRVAEGSRPGNLIEFGYDWRLSNRYSAGRLKEVAERGLKRWRDDGHPDAKLVLYCHSMGGLVARYYLHVLGGAEHTRALITVGTPHRGSLKSLGYLVNGKRYGIGPLGLDVGELVRTFPSAHQLLPTYQCVGEGENLETVSDAAFERLDAGMVTDAMHFHAEIEQAAGEGEPPYRFRMVVGTRQPTFATARREGDRVEPLMTIRGNDERGDGTVARFASVPKGVDLTDLRQLSSSQRHGYLQQNRGVMDDLQGILTARDVVYMARLPDLSRQPGIELPEVAEPGGEIAVHATSADDRLLLIVSLHDADGRKIEETTATNLDGGAYAASLAAPAEGIYEVVVAGPHGAGIEPVREAVVVAPAHGGG